MKNKIYLAILFILLLLISYFRPVYANNIYIPDDAVSFNGHYYKIYNLSMTWQEAQKYCQDLNGHLATITSKEENDFLFNYITDMNYYSAYFGATDKETEGVWQWVTGEEFSYNSWQDGEPSNDNKNEDYAMFFHRYPEGGWNDGDGSTPEDSMNGLAYICEWDSLLDNNEDSPNVDMNQQDNNTETTTPILNKEQDTPQLTEKPNSNGGNSIIFNFNLIGGVSFFGGLSIWGISIIMKNKKNE